MSKVYEFQVAMTCEGCSGAVERILKRHQDKGIQKFDIDLPGKKVTIESNLDQEEVTGILQKCGKEVTFIAVR